MRHRRRAVAGTTPSEPAPPPSTRSPHVTIRTGPRPLTPPASASPQWERTHALLTTWKAHRLLDQALGELRGAGRDLLDPALQERLARAEAATAAALAALEEIDVAPPPGVAS